MIKLLIGGSPCTYWSIAQKNGRETEAEGMGWELFKNYLIAKEKFKPDYFLYENNKSAAQAIKDQISQELEVPLMYINSALVSAQNRQRFYAFNWEVEQPEDRGILLRDILESGESFGTNSQDKAYCLTARYHKGLGTNPNKVFDRCQDTMVAEPVGVTPDEKAFCLTSSYQFGVPIYDTLEKSRRSLVAEPVGTTTDGKAYCLSANYANGSGPNIGNYAAHTLTKGCKSMVAEPVGVGYRGRMEDGKWVKRYESNGEPKANALTTATTDSMVGEPIHVGDVESTAPICHTIPQEVTVRKYTCDITQFQSLLRDSKKASKLSNKVIAETLNKPQTEVEHWFRTDKYFNIPDPGIWFDLKKLIGITSTEFDDFVTVFETRDGVFEKSDRCYDVNGKMSTLMTGKTDNIIVPTTYNGKTVYEVRNGLITIKDKQYPIKLADGYYIIRKLTPVECERLQTLPDGYTRAVSNAQRYKGLGNGWTAEVIIHILNGALKDVPRDEEIVVLSMYDGIGTGRYCLDKMGFTNVKYFAYEIDKYATQVAMSNYPDIIHLGDAFDVRHPDWTIGY